MNPHLWNGEVGLPFALVILFGVLFCCFFKAVKESIQNVNGLWSYRFYRNGFKLLTNAIHSRTILLQLYVGYGLILAPDKINAGLVPVTEKWMHFGNSASEQWFSSVVPPVTISHVNGHSLHFNEHQKRISGVALPFVEKEPQANKAGRNRASEQEEHVSIWREIAHTVYWIVVIMLMAVGFTLPFQFDWFFIKLFNGDYFCRAPKTPNY